MFRSTVVLLVSLSAASLAYAGEDKHPLDIKQDKCMDRLTWDSMYK